MRKSSFENCRFVLDHAHVPTRVNGIDVGGAETVVFDNQPGTRNPLFSLTPNLEFLDQQGSPTYRMDFLTGDISGLRDKYPLVYCLDTLEHVANPFLWVSRLAQIARPGGFIYLATVFQFPYHPSPQDFWRFTPSGLMTLFSHSKQEILDCNWEDEKTKVGVYILARRPK